MSYREKTTWISLFAMTGVYGWYFWKVMPVLASGHGDALQSAHLLGSTIALVAALQIIPMIAFAAASPADANAPHDEREKFYALKGTQAAYFVAVAGALFVSVDGIFFGASVGMLANLSLLSVVTSNLAKYAVEVAHFRFAA
jgi:hypothetical protein